MHYKFKCGVLDAIGKVDRSQNPALFNWNCNDVESNSPSTGSWINSGTLADRIKDFFPHITQPYQIVINHAEKENIVFDANDIEETRDALDYIEAEPFHRIEIFIQLQPGVANAVPMKIQQQENVGQSLSSPLATEDVVKLDHSLHTLTDKLDSALQIIFNQQSQLQPENQAENNLYNKVKDDSWDL